VRGIYPIIATVDRSGYAQIPDGEVAERFGAVLQRRAETMGEAGERR
jgi:hypothetical protein